MRPTAVKFVDLIKPVLWTGFGEAMGSNSMPVRIAHGWAIAWLDFYQTPAIVTEGAVSEAGGFWSLCGVSTSLTRQVGVNNSRTQTTSR